jgi:hypothetical protein
MCFWRVSIAFSSLLQEHDQMTREEEVTGITDPSKSSAASIPEGSHKTSGELKLNLIVYYKYCEFKLICYLFFFAFLLPSFVMHVFFVLL